MKYAIVVLVLVVLAYLVMNFNSRTAELSHLTAEHQIVKAGRDSRLETKSALEATNRLRHFRSSGLQMGLRESYDPPGR